VKIAIEPSDALAGRLRAGMSVEPVIDTRSFVEAGAPTSGAANVAVR
jgi:multidrug resistance efflux pump